MRTFLFLSVLFFVSCDSSNTKSIFNVETKKSNQDFITVMKSIDFGDENQLYEDKDFVISKVCFGEWGGGLYFKRKTDSKLFFQNFSCPVSVNKIDSKYFVSESSTHEYSNCSVHKIESVENLNQVKTIAKKQSELFQQKIGSNTEKLVDSSGIFIVSSFVSNHDLYSVLTNNELSKTTISKIQNGKFVTVLDISNYAVLNYNSIILNTGENLKIIFQNPGQRGILHIKENQLVFEYFKK